MAGRCMAASTSSGTLVGPGMLRNSRPWLTLMSEFSLWLFWRAAAIEPLVFRRAQIANDAGIAPGLARLTDIAAVQNEPVMRMAQIRIGDDAQEAELNLERGLALRQIEPMRHPEDVRIHGQRAFAEGDVEHDVGCLAADAGQGLERLTLVRHLAAMLGNQLPATTPMTFLALLR